MAPGWRLIFDGKPPQPGKLVARFVLQVVPSARRPGTVAEVLQIGVGSGAAVVRSCLTYGLRGGNAHRHADRVINGVRYAVWTSRDAGMSQSISATDMRAVVLGRCYAVERFTYATSAASRDPLTTLGQQRGAAMLDRALASLEVGPEKRIMPLRPPLPGSPGRAVVR